MKVLIVDDSPFIRERLISAFLEIEGIEIVGEAKDGIEALEAISKLDPQLVTLDIRMPGRDGIDVLRDIKVSHPDMKVLILTNYPYPQYRSRCMAAGADYFFEKSNEFKKVVEVLKQLVNGGQSCAQE